jgi:hypothetical protein
VEYKGRTGEDGTFLEAGVGVTSAAAAAEVLRLMGLRPGLLIRRVRRTARLSRLGLALDDVWALGKFLEIEALAPGGAELLRDLPEVLRRYTTAADLRPAYGDQILAMMADPAWRERHDIALRDALRDAGIAPAADGTAADRTAADRTATDRTAAAVRPVRSDARPPMADPPR